MANSGLGAKRQAKAKTCVSLEGKERECRSFFLDSGAHSLFNLHCFKEVKDKEGKVVERRFKNKADRYKWYSKDGVSLSKEFMAYMDQYAKFVLEHKSGMDYYATVDVIYNPELSWKSIVFLKKHYDLDPVPVIHHRTPMSWVRRYLDAGYTYIGLGGLGQQSTKSDYYAWADAVYGLLCDFPDRKPRVRTHGFAMTSWELLMRYPWWSVDSSSAYKVAGNGGIYVPHMRGDEFTFLEEPYVIGVSHRSTASKHRMRHTDYFKKHRPLAYENMLAWLKKIDIPLGVIDDNQQVIEYGVRSEYNARALANLRFFQHLCAALPKWPWSFRYKPKSGFFPLEKIK